MRSLYAGFGGVVLTGVLACLAPGCGGESELAKVPDATKPVNPAQDMPTLKDIADQKKAAGKTAAPAAAPAAAK